MAAIRLGCVERSSPEAAERCTAGAGLDGDGARRATIVRAVIGVPVSPLARLPYCRGCFLHGRRPRGSCFSSRSTRGRLTMGCEGRTLQSLSRTRFDPKAACRTLSSVNFGFRPMRCPRFIARLRPSAVRVRIRSRSTSARPPRTAIIKRPVLVPVSAHGSATERNRALASTICLTMANRGSRHKTGRIAR
jgi:hypothetical protein